MTSHEIVTCDSRVVSQGASQCPDPTRPDPTHSVVTECMHRLGSNTEQPSAIGTDQHGLDRLDACDFVSGVVR